MTRKERAEQQEQTLHQQLWNNQLVEEAVKQNYTGQLDPEAFEVDYWRGKTPSEVIETLQTTQDNLIEIDFRDTPLATFMGEVVEIDEED